MFKKLAGMTGTADTEAAEFRKIYNYSHQHAFGSYELPRCDLQDRGGKVSCGRSGN
jgi:preprotein translocase subunit SecA